MNDSTQPEHRNQPASRLPCQHYNWPLLAFNDQDRFTIRDSVESIGVFGEQGSGKSSSVGMLLTRAYLTAVCGGLILTAKQSAVDECLEHAAMAGALGRIIIVGPDYPNTFNFLQYEATRPGPGAGSAQSIVDLLDLVLRHQPGSDRQSLDQYWELAASQLSRNAFGLNILGTGSLHFDIARDIVRTAPQSAIDVTDASWRAGSTCWQMLLQGYDRLKQSPDPDKERQLNEIRKYFTQEFAELDPRPRSSIVSMFTTKTDPLVDPQVHRLLMDQTTFDLEDCLRSGQIVLLAMPTHEYGVTGRFVQTLFKTVLQKMAERRLDRGELAPKAAIIADEAQQFLTEYDHAFLTTAREVNVSTFYLFQNIPNIRAAYGGGDAAKDKAHKLLGLMRTKVFLANSCTETNRYASELFGRTLQVRRNSSVSESTTYAQQVSNTRGHSQGQSEVMDMLIEPREFTELARGGHDHGYCEGIVYRSSQPWAATGSTLLRAKFPQTFIARETGV